MRILLLILSLTLVGVLAGCGSSSPPALPEHPFTLPGVAFSITPSAARDCEPETVYQARLDWRLDDPPRKTRLEIRVGSVDGGLLARSNDPVGSAETGPWVRRGTWFLLIDRRSGRMLGAQRAGPERCG
ncbi:MAG TPA: hypothetical protein DDZ76_13985 [Xanthomonadales bacterium]|nr:hypothetical protein [Xanthomonadales bacterium]